MGMTVYYFSGTGNSFATARDIAQRLNGKLVSIPAAMRGGLVPADSESAGIVFPSYIAAVAGVPLIVERFAERIENIKSLRIFAVCTCGGYECVNAIPSLMKLRSILKARGGKLSGMYSVRLPMNNLDYDHIPIPINRNQDEILEKGKAKIRDICDRIAKGKGERFRLVKALFYRMMTPMYRLMTPAILRDLREKAKEPADSKLDYRRLMPLTDRSIVVDENCVGCGTCARVCPVGNIRIVDKRPEFGHSCEICFACDEWCPRGAIHHWSRAKGVKYHHPGVASPMCDR